MSRSSLEIRVAGDAAIGPPRASRERDMGVSSLQNRLVQREKEAILWVPHPILRRIQF